MKTFDFRNTPRLPARNGAPNEFAVPLMNAAGQLIADEQGQVQYITLLWFLLDRTSDDQFVSGIRDTIEAIEFQLEMRRVLKQQLAVGDGLVVLDDAQAARLAEAMLRPGKPYSAALAPCLYPYLLCAKKPLPGDARASESPRAEQAPEN